MQLTAVTGYHPRSFFEHLIESIRNEILEAENERCSANIFTEGRLSYQFPIWKKYNHRWYMLDVWIHEL